MKWYIEWRYSDVSIPTRTLGPLSLWVMKRMVFDLATISRENKWPLQLKVRKATCVYSPLNNSYGIFVNGKCFGSGYTENEAWESANR